MKKSTLMRITNVLLLGAALTFTHIEINIQILGLPFGDDKPPTRDLTGWNVQTAPSKGVPSTRGGKR